MKYENITKFLGRELTDTEYQNLADTFFATIKKCEPTFSRNSQVNLKECPIAYVLDSYIQSYEEDNPGETLDDILPEERFNFLVETTEMITFEAYEMLPPFKGICDTSSNSIH